MCPDGLLALNRLDDVYELGLLKGNAIFDQSEKGRGDGGERRAPSPEHRTL